MPTFKKIKYNGAECATAHADHASVADTATSATSAGTATSASEAAKLATARTIQTNLASGSAASFDGSANVTPGVTGVLPIANGGTGSATKNFCDLNNQQNIGGSKTFTANEIYFGLNKEGHIVMRNDNASLSTVYSEIIQDSNNKCRFLFYYRPTGLTELNMVITKAGVTTTHVIQAW